MEHLERKTGQGKGGVKRVINAVIEVNLFAVLFFAVILTVFSFVASMPTATVLLYVCIASYAAAILCVAAERISS